jgi:ribonuclease HII
VRQDSFENKLLAYEKAKWDEGFSFVAGVDEAGRGPLAGPLVVAAVVFPKNAGIPYVNDSKQVSEKQRFEMRENILSVPGIKYSIIEILPDVIDRLNILKATHHGMREAVNKIGGVEFAFIDGRPVPDFPVPNEAIVKGDSRCASIAAASILAKLMRDEKMVELAEFYPEYGFESHKGYGTARHLEALKKYGPCPIHRRSFAPVRDIINPPPEQQEFDL